MKLIMLSVVFEIASRIAFAQGVPDPMAQLRACSLLDPAERPACLNKLPQPVTVPRRPPGDADGWIVSETTSPVDYTPIVTATTFAEGDANGALKQLSIHCRGGRTELVLGGPATSESGADSVLSYRVDDSQPVQVAAGRPTYGTGVAFRGDVVGLLLSLPNQGGIAIRLGTRAGAVYDAHFNLVGLKAARDRVAAACKWPRTLARPRSK
ncbi:conserved hypothetical protein [Bosea sp. 62]|uniref:hypothetical protein n=1 Tax=unclassified Bosea (in: a-proteobacteria) TaxID=2653178 RepID=UPI001259632B|nr:MULTISPECIES: hypothetical protein [unclassified Bosea (in: a-proteobacteria)]CAD5289212.1 conserved hypothetical protein [Bosea sp. 7B]CAD5300309.1 conserved hypothetical protein [Bosea sp. 21B]CAD5300865.1 conserved hypothetical protein [Bosea sp. 46]VVT62010.1 conserved hypothetical protein [Bosea sp. EC-HK365B]VXB50079.1 conserved hypothetical protein [Bosea sp. 125]